MGLKNPLFYLRDREELREGDIKRTAKKKPGAHGCFFFLQVQSQQKKKKKKNLAWATNCCTDFV